MTMHGLKHKSLGGLGASLIQGGGGGGGDHFCSHIRDRSRLALNGSKWSSQRSKHAQKHAVYDQSTLRSTENCRKTAAQ